MEELKRLTEQYNKIYQRMQDIQAAAEKDGEWSEDQRTGWDAANADINKIEASIERAQRSAALAKKSAELDTVDPSTILRTGSGEVETPEAGAEKREATYNKAFGEYLRYGLEGLNSEQRNLLLQNTGPEMRAQNTTTGSAGGFLIPPGYRAVMTEALKAYGGLYNYANVITTSTGNPLQWPNNDDTSNVGAILAENNPVTELAVTLGSKSVGAFTYTSRLVLVSLQLLQDSAFNLDTWLPGKLGERIGRATAAHFVSGSGSGQPEGIALNATAGVTGAAGFGITYDNIVDLEHSVDPAYRSGGRCRFLFNDGTLAIIRKIKDSQNRPLWLPVPVPGMPATINGQPYAIDQGMAAPGANTKSILFGDFQAGYLIRQVLDMQMVRLAERYAENLQVGYFGFLRLDAKPDNTSAVKALLHGAT
jgi:HK97 family phage major capsid protein